MPSMDREQITKTTVMGLDIVPVDRLNDEILIVCKPGDIWSIASQMPRGLESDL